MSKTLNIESALKCLKSIVDSLRCGLCDQLDGDRKRFGCGHVACEDCVAASGSCLLCLTPPGEVHIEPVVDQPLNRLTKNVAHLLDTFQTLFHVNVNRHHRLSEQLKLEKELFPQCIQAPSKYSNFNKKEIIYKESSCQSVYPGEFVKGVVEMDSLNYVQQWLDKQDGVQIQKNRKPFSDLNVNDLRQNPVNKNSIKTRADLILGKVKDQIDNSENFKQTRTHFKTTKKRAHVTKQNSTLTKLSFKKSAEKENIIKKQVSRRNETIESGIEVDVDTIVICDSQSEVIDKDKLAWLAVLEADRNKNNSASTSRLCNTDLQITNESANILKHTKVPFFKRGHLHEVCQLCVQKQQILKSKMNEAFKPVSISIENETIKTTITVSNCTSTNNFPSKSVYVQTEDKTWYNATHKSMVDQITEQVPAESQDVFTSSSKQHTKEHREILPNVQKQVVVLNSDSDSSNGLMDSLVEVTAVVHRSCEDIDYGVLTEINQATRRCRKRPRRPSPTSTDSSDKENYDPNRNKTTCGKKKRKLPYLN